MADTYKSLLDTLLKPWTSGTVLDGPTDVVGGAFEAAARALAMVVDTGGTAEGGVIHIRTHGQTDTRDVTRYLASFFADVPELAMMGAKRTSDGFELVGAPAIVIDDNPTRVIPDVVGIIELRADAQVEAELMPPTELAQRMMHVVHNAAEGRDPKPEITLKIIELLKEVGLLPPLSPELILAKIRAQLEAERAAYSEKVSHRHLGFPEADTSLPNAADFVDKPKQPVIIDGVDQETMTYTPEANAKIDERKRSGPLKDPTPTVIRGRRRR